MVSLWRGAMRQLRRLLVVAMVAMVVVPWALGLGHSAASDAPRLNTGDDHGAVGSSLHVAIYHFPASTRVAVRFDDARKLTLTTDGGGAASGTFAVPAAVAGSHEITAS